MRVIAISSGKGGVGKTTVALNLAISLAGDYNRRVILVDGNIYSPHLTILLGPKFKTDISSFLSKIRRRYLITHKYGFKFLPMSLKKKVSSQDVAKSIHLLRKLGEITIVDTPAGLGEDTLTILESCDEVIPILTPSLFSVLDASRLLRKLEKMGKIVPGIVINRVERKDYEISKSKILRILKTRILGEIVEDPAVKEALNLGIPLLIYDNTAPAAIELRKIAGKLVGIDKNFLKEGFLGKISRVFK